MSASTSPVVLSRVLTDNAHGRASFFNRLVHAARRVWGDADHIILPHSKHAAMCELLNRAGYVPDPRYRREQANLLR